MYDMSALYQAESVQDAIRLRLEHPEAQIIAGGTDVLVQMREGKRAGKALFSIQGCHEMRGVTLDEEENLRSAVSPPSASPMTWPSTSPSFLPCSWPTIRSWARST